MRIWLLLLILTGAAGAREKLYTDSTRAHLGPIALGQLHNLRRAGVRELLVPTWLPADLRNARVVRADRSVVRDGPVLEMRWTGANPHRALTCYGAAGGFGGPDPDSTVPVSNPTLGQLTLWVCERDYFPSRYSTFWLEIPRSMPTHSYFVNYTNSNRERDALNRDEMARIVRSLRFFRIP